MQKLTPIQEQISNLQQLMFQHVQECKNTGCKTVGNWAIYKGEYFCYISSGIPGQMQTCTECPLGTFLNEKMFELNQIQRYILNETVVNYWRRKKQEDNARSSSLSVWKNPSDTSDIPPFLHTLPILKQLYDQPPAEQVQQKEQKKKPQQNKQQQKIIEDPHLGPKKVPFDEKREEMVNHVRGCEHPRCYRVWSGPWGTFIGGRDGAQYFDFTDCEVGKEMNLAVGWKY